MGDRWQGIGRGICWVVALGASLLVLGGCGETTTIECGTTALGVRCTEESENAFIGWLGDDWHWVWAVVGGMALGSVAFDWFNARYGKGRVTRPELASNACPCGCGRSVGSSVSRRGAAAGYRRASAAMVALRRNLHAPVSEFDRGDETLAATNRALVDGDAVKAWLLDHVHGVARPGVTPDLLVLSEAVERIEEMARGR